MLNLSKTCQYALKSLLHLTKNNRDTFIKIKHIAVDEKIPYNYLRKIFGRLIKEKVVTSGLGPCGGVKLSAKSNKISMFRLIALIDGAPNLSECPLFGGNYCPGLKYCPVKSECEKLSSTIWNKLKKYKLTSFR